MVFPFDYSLVAHFGSREQTLAMVEVADMAALAELADAELSVGLILESLDSYFGLVLSLLVGWVGSGLILDYLCDT